MKKLVKKISNSFLSDWRGMSIIRKVIFVATLTSALALITSRIFFHQFLDLLFVVVLSILTINMLHMIGGIFVAIFKETIKTFPEEWRKTTKIEKILFISIIVTGIAGMISVMLRPLPRVENIIIGLSFPSTILVYMIYCVRKDIIKIINNLGNRLVAKK